MKGCPREADVVVSLLNRSELTRADDELLAHIDTCEVCTEVAMVLRVMAADSNRDVREVRVPAAGQVWWRAAVRARLEAVHAAARPLTWSHGVAGACALGLMAALLGLSWPSIRGAADGLTSYALNAMPFVEAATFVTSALHQSIAAILFVGALVVLAPFALYVALSDD